MKMIEIEIGEKSYKLGYPTRKDAKIAESKGLTLSNTDKALTLQDTLFYTGLLSDKPSMTETKANELFEQYKTEGGDVEEVTNFLVEQYVAFTKSPEVKKKKKAKIIEL